MGRFDDLLVNTPTQPRTNPFDDLTLPQGSRFDDLITPSQQKEGIFRRTLKTFGGAIGAVSNVLLAPQRATTGLIEKGLEKIGVLKPKTEGLGIKAGIKEEKSNIELLKRIGQETGTGGLLTGQYTPTTSVFGNFVRELPVTMGGTLADIFIDPLFFASKAGAVAKGTKAIGKEITATAKSIAEEVPAVQKVGEMLGRVFITRFGQREEFKGLDIARKVEESMVQENVRKIVSPVIEKPAVIQQRITQILKGETAPQVSKELEPLAQEARKFKSAEEFVNSKIAKDYVAEVQPTKLGTKGSSVFKTAGEARMKGVAITEKEIEIAKRDQKIFDAAKGRSIEQLEKEIAESKKFADEVGGSFPRSIQVKQEIINQKSHLADFYNQAMKGTELVGDQELKILAQPIRDELDRIGESISKLNPKLLSEETFAANKGTYFPRLYTDYEFPEGEKAVEHIFGGRAVSIPKEPFKKRILTEAESLAKGTRIEEAGFPALKRLIQLGITEQRQKFFSEVEKLADDTPKPGWIQMSDDKALGELAGKFLPPDEYNAIAKIRHIPSATERIYNSGLTLWKIFKTAYNPATIARNDITNFFILNPLGGVGPHRLDIYARTANEIYTKGSLYQLARKEGLEISTQQAAELTQQATRFYRENKGLISQFFGKIGDFHEVVKNFYGSQDKFFKLANFIKGVQEDGLTPFQALRRANFYLVDYSEVPQAVEWLRKSPVGIPFISFTYGVSKPLAKTLLERPDKLAAYFKILSGVQQMNPTGETQEERQKELDVAPDWIQTGTFLRLPFKDKFERGQFVDLQYILPFNILETRSILPSNPVMNSIVSVLFNIDPFTRRELVKTTDTIIEKAEKYTTQFLAQLLPSFTPFVGTSFNKLKKALQQRPDRNGFVKSKLEVFVDILGGIKITPIDPTIEAQKRAFEKQKELQELHSELKKIMLDKTLFPEEQQRESEKAQKKLREAVQP